MSILGKKIAIIGGGASGLFAGIKIKQNLGEKATIFIYEKNDKVGKKILATGNGKCNLSNEHLDHALYNNSIACDLVGTFDTAWIKEEFKNLGVLTKSDEEGRIYPYSGTANSVLDALYSANLALGNKLFCDNCIQNIAKNGAKFSINGEEFDYCIVACGGKAGVKDDRLVAQKLENFGHKWVKDHPGLCSINTVEDTKALAGIRVKAKVSVNGYYTNGEVLFKPQGLSGIAIFEASRYTYKNNIIHLDLLPEYSLEETKKMIDSLAKFNLTFPKMVALDILKRANNDCTEAIKIAKDYKFSVKGLADYANAQIMVGGIDTNDINPDFESKLVSNLYIIGEVLNVDATCGGFNLHFAWASAAKASESIAKKESK